MSVEPDLRHAIRHAIPKLSAIADDIAGFSTTQLERATAAEELFSVVADLLSALDDADGASGTTTAQEGQEGRSGRNSGVSGETVELRPGEWTPVTTTVPIHHTEESKDGEG